MNGFGKFFDHGGGSSATKFALIVMIISMVMIGGITVVAELIHAV